MGSPLGRRPRVLEIGAGEGPYDWMLKPVIGGTEPNSPRLRGLGWGNSPCCGTIWLGFRLLLRLRLVAFLFDAAEFGEGTEVTALHGVQLPENFREGVGPGGALDVIADGTVDIVRHQGAEEARLDAHEAAAAPIGVDEGIDEVALDGGLRVQLVLVFDGEGFEILVHLTGYDGAAGVNAVLESVETGRFLASGGTRPRGLLGIEAVGLELVQGCHVTLRIAGERKGIGWGKAASDRWGRK